MENERSGWMEGSSHPWTASFLSILLILFGPGNCVGSLKFSSGLWTKEIIFSNSTGVTLPCSAIGSPRPSIQWILSNVSLSELTSLRLFENSLEGSRHSSNTSSRPFRIFPFGPSEYTASLHSNTYQCMARNPTGTLVSPPLRVRAVMDRDFDLTVFPSYSYAKNTAVLKCLIPPFMKEFLRVDSWLFGSLSIISRGRYTIFPSRGELHIRNVSNMDALDSYRCVGTHSLTGKKTISSTSGRLTIQSRSSSVPVRIEKSYMPKEIRVYEGESLEVPCVAVSVPPPTYKWFHRGSPKPLVLNAHFFLLGGSLVIKKVKNAHAGVWTCEASNGQGSVSQELNLVVLCPPSLNLFPLSQRVDLGEEARLTCSFGGDPLEGVFWTKDGGRILSNPPGGEILSEKNRSVLLLHSLGLEDSGLYQCFVQGETTIRSQSARVELGNSKATLLSTFNHVVLQPGSSLSLSCRAAGTPSPVITWSLDGRPLSNTLSTASRDPKAGVLSRLGIQAISSSEGGFYSCLARNELGHSEHSQRVDVYGPPFVKPLSPLSVLAGSNVTVDCPYTGYPIFEVKWTRNGESLPLNERQRVLKGNSSLQILNVQPIDKGEYACSINNERGATSRENFELSVSISPKIEPFAFKEDLQVGGRIRVSCTASLGDLPIKFEWFFNGERLLEGEGSSGISINTVDLFSSSLVIPNLRTGHSGNFTCLASNSASSDSHSSLLIVNVPLEWVTSPSDEVIMSGESIRLDCLVSGVPYPVISWHKEELDSLGAYSPIVETSPRARVFSNGSLFLGSASGEDDGTYLCKAENGISEQGLSKLARLVVNVPAHFTVESLNQTAPVGSRSILLCPIQGNNPIRVHWSRNHIGLSPSDRMSIKEEAFRKSLTSNLVIRNVHRDDSGLFICTASNLYGKATRRINLVVQEPPEVPLSPHIVSFSSRSVNISWRHPYDGQSPIEAYIIEYKSSKEASWEDEASSHIVSGSSTWAELQSLAPSFDYEIRISAKNAVGLSRVSKVLRLKTKEEVPGGPPMNVRGASNGSQSIIVTWRAPLPELRHGSILGYYLGYKVTNSSEPFRYQTLEMKHGLHAPREKILELVLYHLKKYTLYSILVQAYNALGTGPRSTAILVKTDEDVPSAPPSNVACTPLSSSSLLVLWSPPQPSEMNGRLRDYRVTYRPLREWEDSVEIRDVRTTEMKTALYELDKYQNYTIQVVAATRAGEGLRSRSIYCRTKEDVPGAPEDIKALSMDQHSILVSWLPPESPNGKILHHSVFMKTMEGGRQFTQNFKVYPPSTTYKIRGLNQNQPYSFWVSSSTSVGRGVDSEIVSETPSLPIPASIASFSRTLFGAVGEEIRFPCISIGAPQPSPTWTFNDDSILHGSRVQSDASSLWISSLELRDSGNYSCSVRNHFGSDSILYSLRVKKSRNNGVPPAPPTLSVIASSPSSITLGWTPSADGGSPLLGYRIHHHREFGDWDRFDVSPLNNSYTLKNLRCGTHYQFYLQGVNDFGVGERTETVSARTRGNAPLAPFSEDFISVNSSSILLRLNTWRTGGCPISSFVVEYRKDGHPGSHPWILVNNNVKMKGDKTFAVLDLSPETQYYLRITAHNSAGSTIEEYSFVTLTYTGATIAPELIIHSGYGGISFLLSPGFLFSFFSVILIAGLVGILLRCRSGALCPRAPNGSDMEGPVGPSHLCVNNSESDKQIILPSGGGHHQEDSRELRNDYVLEGFCPGTETYNSTLSRKKAPFGKPILLKHPPHSLRHHHLPQHPSGNFYSEESQLDAPQRQIGEAPSGFYAHYHPSRGPCKEETSESEGTEEPSGPSGNWIPLTHLIGAQRL